MNPERWIILVLIVILALVWVNRDNPVDNKAIEKRVDSLESANVILKENANQLQGERDTAISIMLKSLTNTEPVKKKYDENRKAILNTSADSLFNYVKSRANVQPDSAGH